MFDIVYNMYLYSIFLMLLHSNKIFKLKNKFPTTAPKQWHDWFSIYNTPTFAFSVNNN